MIKPKKKKTKPYFDFNEVMDYLETKYDKDFRNYAGHKFTGEENDVPYLDFWHWMLEHTANINNGCFIYMPDLETLKSRDTPEWVKEIIKYFADFLGKDYDEKIWLEW